MKASRLALLAFALCWAIPALAAERLRPGRWEVSATVELPGMASPAPTTQTACLSQEQVDASPAPGLDEGPCKVTDIRRSGAQTTWKLDCGAVGKGKGEITARSATAYDGWMTLETAGTEVRTTISARRLDDC